MGGNVRYGAALAESPEGHYVKTPGRIFELDAPAAAGHWMFAEDPYLWHDARGGGAYYAVARDVVGTFTGDAGGLALFRSTDGLHWSAATHPLVLGKRFTWADGLPGRTQVERPALLFVDQEPVALFGATDGYRKDGVGSFNVHIPLRSKAVP